MNPDNLTLFEKTPCKPKGILDNLHKGFSYL